jgi:hypothetical protein
VSPDAFDQERTLEKITDHRSPITDLRFTNTRGTVGQFWAILGNRDSGFTSSIGPKRTNDQGFMTFNFVEFAKNAMFAPPARHLDHRAMAQTSGFQSKGPCFPPVPPHRDGTRIGISEHFRRPLCNTIWNCNKYLDRNV